MYSELIQWTPDGPSFKFESTGAGVIDAIIRRLERISLFATISIYDLSAERTCVHLPCFHIDYPFCCGRWLR